MFSAELRMMPWNAAPPLPLVVTVQRSVWMLTHREERLHSVSSTQFERRYKRQQVLATDTVGHSVRCERCVVVRCERCLAGSSAEMALTAAALLELWNSVAIITLLPRPPRSKLIGKREREICWEQPLLRKCYLLVQLFRRIL